MEIVLLLSLSLIVNPAPALVRGDAPALQQTAPATPAPRQPARRPSAAVTARTAVTVTVTDPLGKPRSGIRVSLTGPSDRSGTTDTMGQLRVTGLLMGTYRLRFAGDEVLTFEREVAVRAGQNTSLDITLNEAPPPPPPPPAPEPPPAPPAPPVGPAGKPLSTSLVDFLDRNLIRSNEPRRDTLVSCSGNTRSMLVQLNQDQARRLYEGAEVTYYVIAGEGTIRFDGQDAAVTAGSFVSVPRETGHELLRRGRRPLIILAEISGEPCTEAK